MPDEHAAKAEAMLKEAEESFRKSVSARPENLSRLWSLALGKLDLPKLRLLRPRSSLPNLAASIGALESLADRLSLDAEARGHLARLRQEHAAALAREAREAEQRKIDEAQALQRRAADAAATRKMMFAGLAVVAVLAALGVRNIRARQAVREAAERARAEALRKEAENARLIEEGMRRRVAKMVVDRELSGCGRDSLLIRSKNPSGEGLFKSFPEGWTSESRNDGIDRITAWTVKAPEGAYRIEVREPFGAQQMVRRIAAVNPLAAGLAQRDMPVGADPRPFRVTVGDPAGAAGPHEHLVDLKSGILD